MWAAKKIKTQNTPVLIKVFTVYPVVLTLSLQGVSEYEKKYVFLKSLKFEVKMVFS